MSKQQYKNSEDPAKMRTHRLCQSGAQDEIVGLHSYDRHTRLGGKAKLKQIMARMSADQLYELKKIGIKIESDRAAAKKKRKAVMDGFNQTRDTGYKAPVEAENKKIVVQKKTFNPKDTAWLI